MTVFRGAVDRLGLPVVAFFLIVVVAAGASGVALLVAPDETERYFSWTLRPPAAAALIGGFYLASAVVLAWGLTLPWTMARVLLAGVVGLAVPTLVLTLVHDEVFDFGRWQAVAWVALFVTAPITAALLLRRPAPESAGRGVAPAAVRATLGVLAAVLLALAVLVWADGTRDSVARSGPFDLIRLTGTYVGAWCSFLGAVCGFAAWRAGRDEAQVALVVLAVAGAGATVALLRAAGDLRHPVVSVVVAVGLAALAVVLARTNAR